MIDNGSPPVLHLVFNLIRGGTEGQCARLALALADRGWRQGVAVFRREGFFLDRIEQELGPVRLLPIRKIASPWTWLEVWRMARWTQRSGFRILHAWDADAAVFGRLVATMTGIPLVTSRRDLGQIYAGWKLGLMNAADKKARRVVVNCPAIRKAMPHLEALQGKVRVLPNILDLAEFDAQASGHVDLPPQRATGPRLVMVARMDPEKDHRTLLAAMREVVRARPDAQLVLAGDGRERPAVEAFVDAHGLRDQVVILGDFMQVPALLRQADIGLLTPTSNEGLSNSILEYMAARLPVVATDCGGNADLVRHGETGLVVPRGDAKTLAGALLELLADPQRGRAMGAAGRLIVEREHAPWIVAGQFEELYREVVCRTKEV